MTAKRIAMVTIGQTPRTDMVPEMREAVAGVADLIEFGALDGLRGDAVLALAPVGDEPRLVTRLTGGREVVIAKRRMHALLQELLARLDEENFDAIVLLCTGVFDDLTLRTPLIEAQQVVDETVMALVGTIERLGVLVPHREQMGHMGGLAKCGDKVGYSFASPYGDLRFADAGRELADADMIIMHCMGYSEDMRQQVAAESGRPVLLARQIVGSAVRDLCHSLE